MKAIELLTTGLAGSGALTGLNQALRNKKNTPRVDLLGEQAIIKFFNKGKKLNRKQTYYGSLAGDLLFNSVYYSLIAKAKNPVTTGAIMGLSAGLLTLAAPKMLGLSKKYVKSSTEKKYLAVSYYTFGGIMAGLAAKMAKK